jgi:Protein of unknown function (DUF3592)
VAVGGILAVLGLAALGAALVGPLLTREGVRRFREAREFRTGAARVPGVVVDLHWETMPARRDSAEGSPCRRVAMPIFRFHTLEGHPVVVTSPVGTNPPRHRPGGAVTVVYDPDDPSRARIEGALGDGSLLAACLIGVGVLLLGAAGLFAAVILLVVVLAVV